MLESRGMTNQEINYLIRSLIMKEDKGLTERDLLDALIRLLAERSGLDVDHHGYYCTPKEMSEEE